MGMPLKDVTGMTFGRWTVLEKSNKKRKNSRNTYWTCRCICGTVKDVLGPELIGGHSKSCGCLTKDIHTKTDEQVAVTCLHKNYRAGARNRNLDFTLSKELFLSLIKSNCYYCGSLPSNVYNNAYKGSNHNPFLYNGIDRVDSSRGYTEDNVVSCCFICNRAKNNMSKSQFLQWIKRIYISQYHKVTSLTPGQLIDLLFTTDYKTWWAQEDLMKYKDSDPEKATQAAVRAQEYNAKRTKLMRTIDEVFDYTDDTNTEKTYSDGNIDEKENYTYFKDYEFLHNKEVKDKMLSEQDRLLSQTEEKNQRE